MSSKKNRRNGPARPAPLHYVAGALACALAVFSLACIHFYATPAHASAVSSQAAATSASGRIVLDDTETETSTATRTPTNTPSPTATKTSTPAPSPTVTHTATPVPTSTAPIRPTSTVININKQASSPVASSTRTGAGTSSNVTPVVSPTSTNAQHNQSSQAGGTSPALFLVITLASLLLLGILLKAWWGIFSSAFKRTSPSKPLSLTAPPHRGQLYLRKQRPQFAQRTIKSDISYVPYAPDAPNISYASYAPDTPHVPGVLNSPVPYVPQSDAGSFDMLLTMPDMLSTLPYSTHVTPAPVTDQANGEPPGALFRDYLSARRTQAPASEAGKDAASIDPNIQAAIDPYVY